ncbi:pyridine nucleotide-disulfide oxidoreductase [Tersicoccus phoenicis]|uniref:Pyridine nucleotide-disulfide oxidoreductase n=1 Tax=Tersicoccus phoenicis TaxID=554083 RepID=A0A1R1L7P2_9MICC|nr:NAD(P)/FAD-dependent oxidoreductase [Tersicoccus phoenicis]OMH23545.1 pyridine nucleotide-disulfide oxidoreductase [Tersicoccus phoenicis]
MTAATPDRTITTDVVVIGAGPVGENAADRVIAGGLQAVVVESDLAGGECSYWACMPSKALIRPLTAVHAARAVDGAAQAVTGSVDVDRVFARRDEFTSHWDDAGQVEWIEGIGATFLRGRGRISGEREVTVTAPDGGTTVITARHAVVLATGSTPVTPPIDGLADVDFWGTREATSAHEVPGRLAVLGGGVAGMELAQAFARLGSTVTIIARSGVLAKFPRPAVEVVLDALRAEGITVLENTGTTRVEAAADGTVTLTLDSAEPVVADRLLVSTGRRPATDDLGTEHAGVELTDKGGLPEVAPTGQVTGTDWLYAVGDVAGKVLLTHQGKYEARATGDFIAARAHGSTPDAGPFSKYAATADEMAVPQAVFTDPELTMVGRTAEQARDAGLEVRIVELPITVAGSALHADGYTGWAQLVIDTADDTLTGVTFAGPDVSELLYSATVAVAGQVPLDRLWHAVPAYPTISEVWLRLLEKVGR